MTGLLQMKSEIEQLQKEYQLMASRQFQIEKNTVFTEEFLLESSEL
jgi:hypothetical protein